MDLKGAKIRGFFHLTTEHSADAPSLKTICIPHYQRPFKWPCIMVTQLVSDFFANYNPVVNLGYTTNQYFAGSIVTVVSQSEDQLIDGQQRITTIFLANFLKFLILRVFFREAIQQKKSRLIFTWFDELQSSYAYLVGKDNVNPDLVKELRPLLSDAYDLGKESNEIKNLFSKGIKLPNELEGNSEYLERHTQLLSELLGTQLHIRYERESFNEQLQQALSQCCVLLSSENDLAFPRSQNDTLTDTQRQYIEAVNALFDAFIKPHSSTENDVLARTELILKDIGAFLNNTSVCVIQTGSIDDAYTLFEVLNDRSLALVDLDLIKNKFYKHFCNLAKGDHTPEAINDFIEDREAQWGDKIFSDDVKSEMSKLISYFAASFLSGDHTLNNKDNRNLRTSIDEYLRNNYSEKYSKTDFEKDFSVYENTKSLIKQFNLKFSTRSAFALGSAFDASASSVGRVLQYLHAQNLEGVNVAIFHSILKNPTNQVTTDTVNLSNYLFQIALLSKDHKAPREFAVSVIGKIHRNRNDNILIPDIAQSRFDEFSQWCRQWTFNRDDGLKTKILFALLLRTTLVTRQNCRYLTSTAVAASLTHENGKKIQLDHLEPEKANAQHPNDYFSHDEREFHVNGLGNMFPMFGPINAAKRNDPLRSAFGHLEQMGLGTHWLTVETKRLFDENKSLTNVPTVRFFEERKKFLEACFVAAIKMIGNVGQETQI